VIWARLPAARAALADALVVINGFDDGCQIEPGTERHTVAEVLAMDPEIRSGYGTDNNRKRKHRPEESA
jgi:hypothetical protein